MNHYPTLRPKIQTGDLIEVASDTGIISPGIRLVTGQDVSHSAMVIRLRGYNHDDDLMVLEAWNNGIRTRRLSVLVADYNRVYWHPLHGVDQAMRDKAAGWMLARVGKEPDGLWGYDWVGAAQAGLGSTPMDSARLFCSEAVAFAWFWAGILVKFPASAPVPGKLDELGVTLPVVVVKAQAG